MAKDPNIIVTPVPPKPKPKEPNPYFHGSTGTSVYDPSTDTTTEGDNSTGSLGRGRSYSGSSAPPNVIYVSGDISEGVRPATQEEITTAQHQEAIKEIVGANVRFSKQAELLVLARQNEILQKRQQIIQENQANMVYFSPKAFNLYEQRKPEIERLQKIDKAEAENWAFVVGRDTWKPGPPFMSPWEEFFSKVNPPPKEKDFVFEMNPNERFKAIFGELGKIGVSYGRGTAGMFYGPNMGGTPERPPLMPEAWHKWLTSPQVKGDVRRTGGTYLTVLGAMGLSEMGLVAVPLVVGSAGILHQTTQTLTNPSSRGYAELIETGAWVGLFMGVEGAKKGYDAFREWRFNADMRAWVEGLTDKSLKFPSSDKIFLPISEEIRVSRPLSSPYKILIAEEQGRGFPVFNEEGAIMGRQRQLKAQFSPYAEAQADFMAPLLETGGKVDLKPSIQLSLFERVNKPMPGMIETKPRGVGQSSEAMIENYKNFLKQFMPKVTEIPVSRPKEIQLSLFEEESKPASEVLAEFQKRTFGERIKGSKPMQILNNMFSGKGLRFAADPFTGTFLDVEKARPFEEFTGDYFERFKPKAILDDLTRAFSGRKGPSILLPFSGIKENVLNPQANFNLNLLKAENIAEPKPFFENLPLSVFGVENLLFQESGTISKPKLSFESIPEFTAEQRQENKALFYFGFADINEAPELLKNPKLDLGKFKEPGKDFLGLFDFWLPNKSQAQANKSPGYDVLIVNEKGRREKINKGPLPKLKALNLGAEIVDNTPANSFILRKSHSKAKEQDDLDFGLGFKFRPPKGRANLPPGAYVEKNLYRIDTFGEVEGIPLKALKMRKLGLFGL